MPAQVILQPRPYASLPGKLLLLPLLPIQEPSKDLPSEIWTEILLYSLVSEVPGSTSWCWSLLSVCKTFRDIALPLIYSRVQISETHSLEKLYGRLQTADQKWDSIRRIPYSTPGRWVQTMDFSGLRFTGQRQALLLDSVLTSLFPLVPLLSELHINPSFVLSRRVLFSLCDRDGATNLRTLTGLTYVSPPSSRPEDDPFVQLLQCVPNLEQFELVGQGLEPVDYEWITPVEPPSMEYFRPLNLPKLRVLSLLSMHSSPLMLALLHSPLPALRKLTLTPYDDIPYPASLTSALITAHGHSLTSLLLFTLKSWPTRLRPSPDNLFSIAPKLRHLSLENPLPNLTLNEPHHLQILSIPRPRPEVWRALDRLFKYLPHLHVIRARDVKWIRTGISTVALSAGVQGEMREWKRRLARRHIRLLDGDWNEDSTA
ncbi:hypothetical protein D9611_005522 [Ephemerocybe angulata]|uniref:F-box domain-containing protein n=1 Tax=Ephemerocybe angulata TaxID=980116 RepID=A0A8H5F4L1_9AGAR|nr:hypothetical protein D9611_005522 [Tulosesus angulatus]